MEALALLIPFGAFAMVLGIVYIERNAQNRERLAAIEKGMDPSQIFKKRESKSETRRNGLLFVGVSIGLLIAFFVKDSIGADGTFLYITFAFLFGGLALLLSHSLDRKDRDSEDITRLNG